MTGLQIGLQIVGGIALWLLTGFGLTYLASKYDDTLRHSNDLFVLSTVGWPIFIPFIHIHLFFHEGIPRINRKWKAFRAPKVEKKKEKAAAKIRMCPALKLKKYEQLLTEIETMHNRYYYHYIHDQVTEFARIKGGKPEVKEQAMAFDQAIAPIGGWVEVNDWDAVPAEGQEVQAVRWDVVVPMPEPERNENW